jgi:aspartate 1-decarboxylase
LLQFLVAVVDAKLLETVDVEYLETVNIEHTNNSTWYVIASIRPLYFNGAVDSLHNPREKTIVKSLGKFSEMKKEVREYLAAN